jgi:hypothetical protein
MADDYSGLKLALTQTMDALVTDRGISYNDEDDVRLIKQIFALFDRRRWPTASRCEVG